MLEATPFCFFGSHLVPPLRKALRLLVYKTDVYGIIQVHGIPFILGLLPCVRIQLIACNSMLFLLNYE